MSRPDVALDLPRMRHMSVGMTAYAEELAARLPRVAPDLAFATLVRSSALDAVEQIALPLRLARLRPRMVHFLSIYAPVAAPAPFAITVHDLIHLRYPELFKRAVGPYYATVVRAVCARARRVIVDDERTIDDLERFLGVPPRKVAIVALGADERFSRPQAPRAQPARPFFLFVGNHRPHKDLATLFAAWGRLDPALDVDLCVTGIDDVPDAEKPRRARGALRFLGNVDSDGLEALYRDTTALVHPALCEGFGLPMLEAATVGAPVIACVDAVPSVLAPFVQTFAARDVDALAAAMTRALRSPAAHDDARRFARTLTWDRCAERTAAVYREVLEECTIR